MAKKVSITWLEDGAFQIKPPSKPKKITGTRFATILGLNPWASPFESYCQITRAYEEPFEDNIYTIAGKTIEPKVIDYFESLRPDLKIIRPTDVYGEDPFKATWGDFFKDKPIFGGMWDALAEDENGEGMVIEIKTTKRSEDWLDGAPDYYKYQAALYAYLLGYKHYTLVVAFLNPEDYEHPEDWKPTPDNIYFVDYEVNEEFEALVNEVKNWWDFHVVTGISPIPDEGKDEGVLRGLRTNTLELSDETSDLVARAAQLTKQLEEMKPVETELKEIEAKIKEMLIESMGGDDKYSTVSDQGLTYTVTLSESKRLDSKKLKDAGLYEQFCTTSTTATLRKKWED